MTKNSKLSSTNDALDIIYGGSKGCVVQLNELPEYFFDFKNMLAGDVFQKFINHRFPLAIIIPADKDLGERISELIRDHKNHNCVRFFSDNRSAEIWIDSYADTHL